MQGKIGGVKRKTVYFTAPRQVELREESLPALGADDVLVETICSSISAGTEMLVYRGQFPHIIDSHDSVSSNLNYPLAYGYACVGRIKDMGKQVDQGLIDRLIFGFHPHTSSFIAPASSLIFPPASLQPEACSFLPNMETAVNLIQDAAPILGERALVLGQGVVGLLVTSLLKEFPLASVTTSDNYEFRRRSSLAIGVTDSFDPKSIQLNSESIQQPQQTRLTPYRAYAQSFDVTFELSGSPSALDTAIELTTFSGRIIIGSWYGEKRAPVDLGGIFHRSRIQLIASQVSTIAPALSGRWDKARRFEVAWEALKRIQPQKWITHRFPIEEAGKAYELLDKNPQETIQVIFNYS
jgi:2-desacetyl-2-hydroxyethyl bacteriochlorophyllide A dehydrogenase